MIAFEIRAIFDDDVRFCARRKTLEQRNDDDDAV
tara:strand:+ start:9228 stop:9329 length:102 start_codon:yes stop_codon:yes gene_type:complete